MRALLRNHIFLILLLVLASLAMLPGGPFVVQSMAEDEIPVGTAADFNAVVADLNANGGSKTIKLTDDIALTNQNPRLRKGELTILGEGHTLTVSISVLENGTLNLGMDGYEKTLDMPPGRSDLCVVNTDGNGVLNIYKGVTIRDCMRYGQAGGITSYSNSVINMYGGTITNCGSGAVSGGIYLDGHSVFNMYDGTITKCTGVNGSAIGLSGGSAIGPSTAGPVSFNMYGGTISDCTESYMGGGAICAYSSYPVTVNIYGGKIENCKTTATSRYSYGGGAISLFCFADLTFNMEGGEITGCSCSDNQRGYGGAVLIYATGSGTDIQFKGGKITDNSGKIGGGFFLYSGTATVADGFGMYNNTATAAGDDIYNAFGKITLGNVDTTATLKPCGHPIRDWYDDGDTRWGYPECTQTDHLVPFEHTTYSEEFGAKAAHGELGYTITWKSQDGTETYETDENVPAESQPSYDGAAPTKSPDAQYTYTFAGWATEADQESGTQAGDLPPVTDDAVYYAAFSKTPREYTVSFDSEGGSRVSSQTVPYGSAVSRPADPRRSGYTFAGWYLNGQPYDFSTPVTGNFMIVARWNRNAVDPDDPDDDNTGGGTRRNTGGNGGNNPGAPAPAAAAAAPVAAAPAAPATQNVPDNATPLDNGENIDDNPTPLAAPEGHWALINLICTVLTVLGAAGLATRRRKDDEDDDDSRKRNMCKIGAAICAVISVIVLFLTEDFAQPMHLLDKYTILMIVILALCAVFVMVYRILSGETEESEE